MAAAGGQPRSKLAFPADHRWTDRQALAGGEGQRRRPPLLGRKSPADQAGSLWEEGPGPASFVSFAFISALSFKISFLLLTLGFFISSLF